MSANGALRYHFKQEGEGRAWSKFHKLRIISFSLGGEEKSTSIVFLAPSQSEQSQKLHRKDSISHFKFL